MKWLGFSSSANTLQRLGVRWWRKQCFKVDLESPQQPALLSELEKRRRGFGEKMNLAQCPFDTTGGALLHTTPYPPLLSWPGRSVLMKGWLQSLPRCPHFCSLWISLQHTRGCCVRAQEDPLSALPCSRGKMLPARCCAGGHMIVQILFC